MAESEVKCPECGCQQVWKDGIRYTCSGGALIHLSRLCLSVFMLVTLCILDWKFLVAVAEPLDYFDGPKFRSLEVPPSTWSQELRASGLTIQLAIS